jgi:hypothetical protein
MTIKLIDWKASEATTVVRAIKTGWSIAPPVHDILPNPATYYNTRRQSYLTKGRMIANYLNYFIANFDTNNELLNAYVEQRAKFDMTVPSLDRGESMTEMYSQLFTPTLKEKILKMVDFNFDPKVGKTSRRFPFMAKDLMVLSMFIKIATPLVFQYIYIYDLPKNTNIYSYFKPLFGLFPNGEILHYQLMAYSLEKVIEMQEKHALILKPDFNADVYATKLFRDIVSGVVHKFVFDMNPLSLVHDVVSKQIMYTVYTKN